MKRWIHASTSFKDDYNVAKYLPKKSLSLIEEISMEPDFDYNRNRTVYRYTIWFSNGDSISANGISGITQAVKQYIAEKGESL